MKKIKRSGSQETANVKFFITISDFFTYSTPQQHLKLLEHWRELISSDQFYNRSNSPADLLYKHKHLTELYEAAYTAYLIPCNPGSLKGSRSAQQQIITAEQDHLDFYPSHLEETAIISPFNVIKQIFSEYDIAYCKEQLFEWLVDGLSGNMPQDNELFNGSFYIHTVKLIEVCWLIHIRSGSLLGI